MLGENTSEESTTATTTDPTQTGTTPIEGVEITQQAADEVIDRTPTPPPSDPPAVPDATPAAEDAPRGRGGRPKGRKDSRPRRAAKGGGRKPPTPKLAAVEATPAADIEPAADATPEPADSPERVEVRRLAAESTADFVVDSQPMIFALLSGQPFAYMEDEREKCKKAWEKWLFDLDVPNPPPWLQLAFVLGCITFRVTQTAAPGSILGKARNTFLAAVTPPAGGNS